MAQIKYSKPKLAVLIKEHNYNPTAKAGFIVSVLGYDEAAYLISHSKIKGHSGHDILTVKKGRFVRHCCWVKLENLLFLEKGVGQEELGGVGYL